MGFGNWRSGTWRRLSCKKRGWHRRRSEMAEDVVMRLCGNGTCGQLAMVNQRGD